MLEAIQVGLHLDYHDPIKVELFQGKLPRCSIGGVVCKHDMIEPCGVVPREVQFFTYFHFWLNSAHGSSIIELVQLLHLHLLIWPQERHKNHRYTERRPHFVAFLRI